MASWSPHGTEPPFEIPTPELTGQELVPIDYTDMPTPRREGVADSGGGGLKADTNKTRIELFPGDALFAISDILTSGALKYDDRNWEKGMRWSRIFGGLMRHAWAWWQGRGPTNSNFVFGDLDPETQRSHLWHMGACAVFLIAYEMRGVGIDDRPTVESEGEVK